MILHCFVFLSLHTGLRGRMQVFLREKAPDPCRNRDPGTDVQFRSRRRGRPEADFRPAVNSSGFSDSQCCQDGKTDDREKR